jgi:hypothetical protein
LHDLQAIPPAGKFREKSVLNFADYSKAVDRAEFVDWWIAAIMILK